jgi:hypothetical protein
MKVKRMRITEILRRIWLFSANKIKIFESVTKQPTQLIVKLNSSLRQKLGTQEFSYQSYCMLVVKVNNQLPEWLLGPGW